MTKRTEKAVVMVLAFVMTAIICTALLAPFVLAAHYGEGWLALNYITVPGYLLFAAWGDRRKMKKAPIPQPLRGSSLSQREPKTGAGRHDGR